MDSIQGKQPTTVLWPQSVAASTTVTSVVLDTAGALGAAFVLSVGAGDKTVDAKIQRDDNSGMASATDITSAAITQIGTGTTNQTVRIRVLRPTERYVRLSVTTGSGGSTNRLISAVGYLWSPYGTISQAAGLSQDVYVQEGS